MYPAAGVTRETHLHIAVPQWTMVVSFPIASPQLPTNIPHYTVRHHPHQAKDVETSGQRNL